MHFTLVWNFCALIDLHFSFFFFFFAFSRATPSAYGDSQARGLIRAIAARHTPEPQQRGIQASSVA